MAVFTAVKTNTLTLPHVSMGEVPIQSLEGQVLPRSAVGYTITPQPFIYILLVVVVVARAACGLLF